MALRLHSELMVDLEMKNKSFRVKGLKVHRLSTSR